jgi:hypothetical protein
MIQEGLDRHGMGFSDVALDLGISYSLVLYTAHGSRNNRRVLRRFLELGIDPAHLDLPEDLRAETNNTMAVAQ